MPSRERRASRFRGLIVAAFTALLAVTAHGMVSGGFPTGGTAALLVVSAAGIGAMVGASDRAGGRGALLGVLALGQMGGHLVLSSGGHQCLLRTSNRDSGTRDAPGPPGGGGARCHLGRGLRAALRRAVHRRSAATAGSPDLSRRPGRSRCTTVRPSTAPRVARCRIDIAPRSPGRRRTLTVHLNSPAIQGNSTCHSIG